MARKVHSRLPNEPAFQAIVPKATLSDLALPASGIDQLRRIVADDRHRTRVGDGSEARGRISSEPGTRMLFAGEGGAGKTMAAEAIASELGLPLYRIDLSAVVGKYIGETEKNLRHIFDAAEADGGVLFFDEADALFGKRSEVKDSHDRYANVEVSYLRQRIERHPGIVILAARARSAIDAPFLRRLGSVVDFPRPGVLARPV